MDAISISNFVLPIRVGVSSEERASPQRVRIDLIVLTDFTETIRTGSLECGVNYAHLRRSIRDLVSQGEFVLLETLGHCIIQSLLAVTGVSHATVMIQKLDVWPDATPGILMARYKDQKNAE